MPDERGNLVTAADDRSMGVGSAMTLKGLAYTLSVFVDHGRHTWTQEQKLARLGALRLAEHWLVRQALRYGVTLRFHCGGNFGLESSVHLPTIPPLDEDGTTDPPQILNDALRICGWPDPKYLYAAIAGDTGADNVHAVIHLDNAGRSVASSYARGGSVRRFLESCVVHARHSSGVEKGPSTIAHEILHLYAAWDMYADDEFGPAQVELAKRRFPNDIMVNSNTPLDRAEVGPVTAWRVGWAPKEQWFEQLRPSDG